MTPLNELFKNAATIPAIRSKLPKIQAFIKLIFPLGIALSGRSTLSNSKSKISLKTIPPPYNPIVEKHRSIIPIGFSFAIGVAKLAMATPAKISAIAVTMLAGRDSCKYAFIFKIYLANENRIFVNPWNLSSS